MSKKIVEFSLSILDENFNVAVKTKNNSFKIKGDSYLSLLIRHYINEYKKAEKDDDEIEDNIISYGNNVLSSYKLKDGRLTMGDHSFYIYKEEKLRCKLCIDYHPHIFTNPVEMYRIWLPIIKRKNR